MFFVGSVQLHAVERAIVGFVGVCTNYAISLQDGPDKKERHGAPEKGAEKDAENKGAP